MHQWKQISHISCAGHDVNLVFTKRIQQEGNSQHKHNKEYFLGTLGRDSMGESFLKVSFLPSKAKEGIDLILLGANINVQNKSK